jgi:dTDP-glucose pyrophosphorylase
MLDWTLGALPLVIDRVLVVVHHLADQIETYLQKQKHLNDYVVVRQEVPRGTGDALRACQAVLRGDRFMALNGDDLYGASDLAELARCQAGVLVHTVQDPRRWGIAFLKTNGALDRLVEKPDLEGPQLANTGAYIFPSDVFDIPLAPSARGEYEITDYVSAVAKRQAVEVVPADFWMPIGTIEVWQQAQELDLESKLRPRQ